MDQINEKLDFLKALIADPKWQQITVSDGITTEKRSLSASDIACFRSHSMINATAKELMDYIWTIYTSSDFMKKYNSDISQYRIIENYDSNKRLCYQVNTLPWPMWPRDSLYLQARIVEGDYSYILMYSVDSTAVPEQKEKYVRAYVNISAFVFKEEDTGCMVYRIGHIEPGGTIPAGIVNSYATKTADMIRRMQKIYNK